MSVILTTRLEDRYLYQYFVNILHTGTDYSCSSVEADCSIRKTCLCDKYPLKPHFYKEKLGFAGVYLSFLFLLQNIDCGYSLEPPRRGGSEYPQSIFWSKNKKNVKKFIRIFSFFTTLIISVYCMDMFS